MKEEIHKKIIEDGRTLRVSHKLPAMSNYRDNGHLQWSDTIRIQRIDREVNS